MSDYTAYMYLGDLIEFGETDAIFTAPKQRPPKTSPANSADPRAIRSRSRQTPRAHPGRFVLATRRRAFSASAQRASRPTNGPRLRAAQTAAVLASPAKCPGGRFVGRAPGKCPMRPLFGLARYAALSVTSLAPERHTPHHRHPRRQRIQLARIIGQHPHRLHPR